ncbi:hypothetical protein [Paramuribaculum intestinale]|uniref:hypothetical protein n=1 Tax=Paramuribaculum intestinale TaxID=2094151 RepID=UPI0025A95B71|nr:hypothetical protein [Paramuribaculum intestinale]
MNEITVDKPLWETKIGTILRWISVLPGSIIAMVLSVFIASCAVLLGDLLENPQWLLHPEYIIDGSNESYLIPVLRGAVFVYSGSYIAPQGKKGTSLFLFGLIGVCFGILGFFSIVHREWELFIRCLITIISGGITCCYIFKKIE